MRITSVIAAAMLLTVLACESSEQPYDYLAGKDWSQPLAPGSSHATTLTQITPENVGQLEVAWTYRSGDLRENSQIQCNPIILDGNVYATTPMIDVVCLNGVSGEEIWRSSPMQLIPAEEVPASWAGTNRGLVYAHSDQGDRIFVTQGPYLFALDPADGSLITTFGKDGRIDMRQGLREGAENAFVLSNSPGVVYEDLLIMGSRVDESAGAAPGHIRAFDIHSGEIRWMFHTIPAADEPGADTWPEGAHNWAGGANAWAGITLDPDRGLVFAPTGSASYDFYGANRPGDNLYANSLLALDARSGKLRWHFQFVHHDLLDRDLPAAPVLIEVQQDGKTVPAVAQTTKTGHLFLFHRETGEPIFPIEEVDVPLSDMPGEQSSPTQPLPTAPPPFSVQSISEVNSFSPNRDSLQAVLDGLRKRSIFEPPSIEGTLVFPGYDGGAEWGGGAFDPWSGLFIVNSSNMAWTLHMIPTAADHPGQQVYLANCAACHGADLAGGEFMGKIPSLQNLSSRREEDSVRASILNGRGTMPAFASLPAEDIDNVVAYLMGEAGNAAVAGEEQQRSDYVSSGYKRFLDADGYPAIAPPWGQLTAIDVSAGEIRWQIPFGEFPELTARGIPPTGTENYGGPVVTASGLTFIAATEDAKIRAYRTATGEQLWEAELPAGGFATPAVYEANGKQYIIIACGGGKGGTPSGDAYVAFALPD